MYTFHFYRCHSITCLREWAEDRFGAGTGYGRTGESTNREAQTPEQQRKTAREERRQERLEFQAELKNNSPARLTPTEEFQVTQEFAEDSVNWTGIASLIRRARGNTNAEKLNYLLKRYKHLGQYH